MFTCLFLVLGVLYISFLFFYQKKKFTHQRELVQLKDMYEKEILKSKLEIQEQTFRNLSQEIHDNIGQMLSLVKLNIGTMDIKNPGILQQKIDDSKLIIGKVIKDLRDLSRGLSSDYISDMGLAGAIGYEMEMARKTGVYEANFSLVGSKYKIEPQKELILFRIVQEVLNNILKHAKATRIDVVLEYAEAWVYIRISDDGEGFDPDNLKAQENNGFGSGIKNMRNRAQLIGATFKIESNPGKGTIIFLQLPLHLKTSEYANN
jgi:signal transduction histidine kinase